MTEYPLFIDGERVATGEKLAVNDKYRGEPLALVAIAGKPEVERAVAAAKRAAVSMAAMPSHRRGEILARAATLLRERREELAHTIAAEAGKALKYARVEADRGAQTFAIAAEEAKRIHGETVPLDAVPAGEGYFGFSRPLLPSTSPSTWWPTRWPRRSPPATPSCSSLPRPRPSRR
jgi:acyl-CoA reductase-like NAD-dependent aldehyde dehydrogenase